MIILKFILNLILIYIYLKSNGNYRVIDFKLSEVLSFSLIFLIVVLSLINFISITQNIILGLLIALANYLYNYLLSDKIKVNLNDSNIYIESENNICDFLKEIKIKRLETILKRYNL